MPWTRLWSGRNGPDTGANREQSQVFGQGQARVRWALAIWASITVFAIAQTASADIPERKPETAASGGKVDIANTPAKPVTPLVVSFKQRQSGAGKPHDVPLADSQPTILTIGRGQDLVGTPATFWVERSSAGARPTTIVSSSGRSRAPAFRSPLTNSWLTSGYGNRIHPILGRSRFHQGVDLAASNGTPVLAASEGVVVLAGWAGGYGIQVVLDHGGGYQSRYAHLSKLLVETGQVVKSGDNIGLAGATGLATGPHLHFEIRHDGYAINPQN